MNSLLIVSPNPNKSCLLNDMINSAASNFDNYEVVYIFKNGVCLENRKIIFAVEINEIGVDLSMLNFLIELKKSRLKLTNSSAVILAHSCNELGTKRFSQDLIYILNNLGCTFIGQPLVEATHSLINFLTWQKSLPMSLKDICLFQCKKLGKRLKESELNKINNPKITVLYSSPHNVSNTLSLWHIISQQLIGFDIQEIQIENGKILDCKGCNYKLCLHYAEQNSCFYGGFMVENVLPAVENSDVVIFLCPNYNDSISANITAVINRLTVLYHKISFYNKLLYGIVVSGNSGSDSVAKQLIGSININKGFKLPPYAVLTATANDPNAIFKIIGIENIAQNFAQNMMDQLTIS